jgi:hypothetical protein
MAGNCSEKLTVRKKAMVPASEVLDAITATPDTNFESEGALAGR